MVTKNICFIILFIFFCKNLLALEYIAKDAIEPFCNGNLKEALIDDLKLEKVSINVIKNKRWTKNLLNLHLFLEKKLNESEHKSWVSNFRINDDYKKKFKADVFVKFKNYEACRFKGKIRVTGDMWWHLDWKNGSPITSIHVELLNGNIYNVTKFKLFLPKARYGYNEIFVSNLFRELGFLSPKTFFLKGRINNVNVDYIFQEDLRKELIENSLYREGPLLEGDERFTVKLTEKEKKNFPNINYAKISNKNFLEKNYSNSIIGLEALSNINKLYLYNHKYKFVNNITDPFANVFYLFTDVFFKNKKNIEILNTFESLSYALDAVHGLSMDERRFYYDRFNKLYLPIYYDGKSNILENDQISNFQINNKKNVFPNETIRGAKNSIKLIEDLNLRNFLTKLEKSGMKISYNELESIISKIKLRLKILKNSKISNRNTYDKEGFYSRTNKYTDVTRFIFTNHKKNQFFICKYNFKDCEILSLSRAEYFKILSDALHQEFNTLNKKIDSQAYVVFLSDHFNKDKNSFNYFNNDWKTLNFLETSIEYKDVKINLDEKKKIISIDQLTNDGKVLFLGGKLTKWDIKFNGLTNKKGANPENNLGDTSDLTGCVNFYEVEFNFTSITSNNSVCEDSVNIIRSKGTINKISINNSISDSLDVDFSNIIINSLRVNNSRNDCADFSYGVYILDDAKLINCGDKAVSIGEKSNMKINNINVNKSFIGVASKDSSQVKIQNGNFLNSDICLSAYRKKIEFSGGKLILHDINCDKKKYYFSNDSQVIFN